MVHLARPQLRDFAHDLDLARRAEVGQALGFDGVPDFGQRQFRLVGDGVIAHSAARQVFTEMVKTGDRPEQVAQREGLVRVDDDAALRGWIDEVLVEHPVEAQRFLAGEKKLQGVLVGFVMKKSKGSADARKVNQLLAARVPG